MTDERVRLVSGAHGDPSGTSPVGPLAIPGSGRWSATARALVVSMRPRQWTKNLVVFAAVAFAGDALDPGLLVRAALAFGLFCLMSGAVYLLNDVADAESDKTHAKKRLRPVASGELGVPTAVAVGLSLGAAVLAGSFAVSTRFGLVVAAYAALQATYTLVLKHHAILDAMAISAGFVLRAVAGAVAIAVPVSQWLLLCTFLLALFLALAKRRHELTFLEGVAEAHRPALGEYTLGFIDAMLSTTAAATIVAYALYTIEPGTGEAYPHLMLTVPFVIYGLFRYLSLVHQNNLGGSPEEILLSDRPLIIDLLAWGVVTAVILYVLPS